MCADFDPSSSEQIGDGFDVHSYQLDLPPEALPGYMAPILRASQQAPSRLEIAPAMFSIVPHWADHNLARQTHNTRSGVVGQYSVLLCNPMRRCNRFHLQTTFWRGGVRYSSPNPADGGGSRDRTGMPGVCPSQRSTVTMYSGVFRDADFAFPFRESQSLLPKKSP